jgi:glutathione gamma-glutamylcysteinyltransferase
VEAFRGTQVSKEQFLKDLRRVCGGNGSVHMVLSYSRTALGQTGDGHYSPVGALNESESGGGEGEGQVLVLDVARFKYPSYWVGVDMLWESLKPVDKETGLPRGYFLLKRCK